MRIGVCGSLARRGQSGIGQYLLGVLPALLQDSPGDECFVFAPAASAGLFAPLGPHVRLVPVGQRDAPPLPDLAWHQFALPALARDLRLDVLHIPSQRRLLWRRPCALVATIQDPGAFRRPRDPMSRGSCPAGIFRALARRQDMLVTPSEAAARELGELTGLAGNRITAIPCGVDRRRFQPGGREEAATLVARRYALHPPFFLSVTRLEHPARNHARVIEAFNAFKTISPSPWQLVLLGGNGGGADQIRGLVLRSPYAQDIHCLGEAAPEDMPHWYRLAGALVHVPLRRGFGLPLREAMACGCPVLAADEPAARECCGPAALYADHQDAHSLQCQLMALAGDPGLRARLAAAAVERVAASDWRETAGRLRDVYARAAHHAKRHVVVGSAITTPAH